MKLIFSFLVGLFLLCSCGVLDPEQHRIATQVINDLLATGQITQEQHTALLQALSSGGETDWGAIIGTVAGGVLASILASMGIITRMPSRTGLSEGEANELKKLVRSQ